MKPREFVSRIINVVQKEMSGEFPIKSFLSAYHSVCNEPDKKIEAQLSDFKVSLECVHTKLHFIMIANMQSNKSKSITGSICYTLQDKDLHDMYNLPAEDKMLESWHLHPLLQSTEGMIEVTTMLSFLTLKSNYQIKYLVAEY